MLCICDLHPPSLSSVLAGSGMSGTRIVEQYGLRLGHGLREEGGAAGLLWVQVPGSKVSVLPAQLTGAL